MNITYQRDVSHLSKYNYVKDVSIKEIIPALNSDNLEIIKFNEILWQYIAKKGIYKRGDKLVFIPPETIIPFELSEKLNITKYLSNGIIKVITLKGNNSEGLIVQKDLVEPYLEYILQWNYPLTSQMMSEQISPEDIPLYFSKLKNTHIPNLFNFSNDFKINDFIYYAEKIHGMTGRWALLPHPHNENIIPYVGSHSIIIKENNTNVCWKIYNNYLKDKLIPGYVFYGEIFGPGIYYHYNRKDIDFRIFAIKKNNEFLSIYEVIQICSDLDIPFVKFYNTQYKSIDHLKKFANTKSEYDNNQMKEGIVIYSIDDKNLRMAKIISDFFLKEKKH